MSNLHPKDNAFIEKIKSYYLAETSNIELCDIYNVILNSIKNDSLINMVNLFNIIVDKSTVTKGLQNLFIQIVKKCKINSIEDLKLITNLNMYEFAQKHEISIICYNDTPSFYEKLCYAKYHYNIETPSLILSDEDITDMNDDYYTYYNENEIIEDNPYMKLDFAVYHILNIHETAQYNRWNDKYHMLYMNLLRLCFKRDDINLSKHLIKCIEPTAIWIHQHINLWLNHSNSSRYQFEIIDFINLFSNKYMLDILNSTGSISNKIIDCISLFQQNLQFWFSNESPFNIYTKVAIINGSRYSRYWNSLENVELLIKFYIELEKYNEYTGFDSRNSIRQNIIYILFSYTSNIEYLKHIFNNDKILWYKFVVLLINQYDSHIKYIEMTASRFKNDIMSLTDRIEGNDNLIDMTLTTEAIIICNNISNEICDNKYSKYIIYETVLWLNRIIKIFTNTDVYEMFTCFYNMTDVAKYSYFTENNIRELFDTLIEGIVSFLDKDKISKIWSLYLGDNIDKNKHNEFINNMREFKTSSILKYDALINDLYDRYKSYENIPNEFIDPMICELIEDPVEIPVTKLIMDAKIIYKHIVLKNDNPFNRQPLTIEELDKYQQLEEVKCRIDEWKKREEEWLNSF